MRRYYNYSGQHEIKECLERRFKFLPNFTASIPWMSIGSDHDRTDFDEIQSGVLVQGQNIGKGEI